MSSMALSPAAVSRPAVNHWVVAGVVVVPTFMEILDTTIANVALRYIAGGLSAAQTDAEWVITSYLAANAIVLPITGWLSAHLGRRNYFLLSIAIFTLASAMCGFATSLPQMILFRVIQGLAGGGLQPCSQGILLDAFPPEKQGTAMTLFGVAAMIAPIVGPTLGGWLCVNYNWRWIFLINVPIGLLALVAAYAVVDDPDYLKQERAELRRKPLNFDYIGLGLLVLVMSCWEIMLSKGQEWDWLGDPFGRVQTLLILFVLGLGLLIVREMRTASPIINFRVLGERNFAMSCVIMFFAFAVVYCAKHRAAVAAPGAVRLRRPCLGAGRCPRRASPRLAAMVVAGILLGRQVDARWLIAAGLVVMAAAYYWMARMNLQISPWQVVWPRMLMALGWGCCSPRSAWPPTSTLLCICAGRRSDCSACSAPRGAASAPRWPRPSRSAREQFHLSRLGENLGPLNPHVQSFLEQAQRVLHAVDRRPGPVAADWRSRRSTTCASSRPRRSPSSTSSGCAPSWRWRSSFWCC